MVHMVVQDFSSTIMFLFYALIFTMNLQRSFVEAGSNLSHTLDGLLSGYDKRIRPDHNGPPTTISLFLYVDSLGPLQERTMDFSGSFYLSMNWTDDRLPHHSKKSITLKGADTEHFWLPDLFFWHEKSGHHHNIIQRNQLLKIYPDGLCQYIIRISLTVACKMVLTRFPFDTQICSLTFTSFAYLQEDIMLHITDDDVVYLDDIVIAKYDLIKRQTGLYNVSNVNLGTSAVAYVHFTFKRQLQTYILTVYIPSLLLVILAWMSFWIDAHAAPARVSLGITTVLTSTTMTASMQETFPDASGAKASDIWLAACLLFVFLSLIEYAITNYLIVVKERKKLRLISLAAPGLPASNENKNNANGQLQRCPIRTIYNPSFKESSKNDLQNEERNIFSSAVGLLPLPKLPRFDFSDFNVESIDILARIVFAGAFIVFNVFYWAYYLVLYPY